MVRDISLDNAKFLMIFLVVFGHIIEPNISQSPLIKTIYASLFSFHIPVFAIISGKLTKNDYSKERIYKMVTTLLVPFIAFTFFYELYHVLTEGSLSKYTLKFQPYWFLWYLYSLFLWKTFLPVVLLFRYPIFLSVVISVIAGYIDWIGYFLGISRTLYFFPFFLVGHITNFSVLTESVFSKIPKAILIAFLILNLLFFWLYNEMPHQWLYGSFSYSRLETGGWTAAITKIGFYIISITTAFAILHLVPSKKRFISKKGRNSLFVFVWHGFFVKLFYSTGLITLLSGIAPYLALLAAIALAFISTFILSTDVVAMNTKRFVLKPIRLLMLNKN